MDLAAGLPAEAKPVIDEAIDRLDADAKALIDYALAGFGGAVAGALHEASDVATPAVAALNDFTAAINRVAAVAERLLAALSRPPVP